MSVFCCGAAMLIETSGGGDIIVVYLEIGPCHKMLHMEPLVRRSNRPRPIRTMYESRNALKTHPMEKKRCTITR